MITEAINAIRLNPPIIILILASLFFVFTILNYIYSNLFPSSELTNKLKTSIRKSGQKLKRRLKAFIHEMST